ncbi:hypothetical protein CVIRNUC_003175 [Coccomyxa viridis]|uniref:OCEL domain-containing protein n=1 Tax=Coccomyxa viridis TaxID=1274662 RepID=A0AAV1I0W9_9CHLO|nr:hypothetical protein CVIRNUC_003175 [Coccomyxa viridis]
MGASSAPIDQPKHAVQLQIDSALADKMLLIADKGQSLTFCLEATGGILTAAGHQHAFVASTGQQDTVVRLPGRSAGSGSAQTAVIRQKRSSQHSSCPAEHLKDKQGAAQQSSTMPVPVQQQKPKAPPGTPAVSQGCSPQSKGGPDNLASQMQRAKSGSPPPWAHKFGPNAVFRPALGLGGPSAYPGNRSTPEPQLAPHKPPLHMPSPDRAAVRQRATPEPVRAPSEPSRKDSDAQARQQGPEQVLNKQRATSEPARGLKKRHTPESDMQGQQHAGQQPAKHPRLTPERVQGRSVQSTPEPDMPAPTQKPTAQLTAGKQRTPEPAAQRSARSTPEQDAQALRRALQQPGRPKSALPRHLQPGQLPPRPPLGSSREATPDAGFGSSSSGLSTPEASRDNTPQPGLGLTSLHGPTTLSRPSSTANLPGSAAQPGPALAAKAKKKPRQLLGKKAAGKKKPGQEDVKRMDIPREAFVGARKGLIYCLVGLISQKRYSSQSLARAIAEVGRQVKDMRVPSAEFLREQALKIADYKSPGMWVLMSRYQSFAEELRAEAEKEASPDHAMSEASAGATPEPEAAIRSKRPASNNPPPSGVPANGKGLVQKHAQQGPAHRKPAKKGDADRSHSGPGKKRLAPSQDPDVEISDTDSEGARPAKRQQRARVLPAVYTDSLRPTPSPSRGVPEHSSTPAATPAVSAEISRPSPSPGNFMPQHSAFAAELSPEKWTTRSALHKEKPLPAQQLRPQTPSELDTSQEDNDTWYAEHAQRDPIRHAPIASGRQYDEYVEEYDSKFQDYHQLRQAMGRVQRYVSALETGSMAARTEHERAWYEQQAQRLNRRVQPLMLRWTQAYKVLHEELQSIRGRLEQYQQIAASYGTSSE